MKPFALALSVALAGASLAPAADPPAHKLAVADAKRVRATVSYEVRATKGDVTRWTAFLPEPPELPSQTRVQTAYTPAARGAVEKSPQARKVRVVDAPANGTPGAVLRLKFEVEAVLRSRALADLKPGEEPPAVPPLAAAERKLYLAASTRIDHESEAFRDWLAAKQLRRAKGESELDLAARVLAALRADFTYHADATADKRASTVCKTGKTDCGGMSFAFVAALRANGVPARALVGRLARPRAPNSKPGDFEYDQPHVRAEFFADRIGWVPVDPAEARAGDRPVRAYVGRDAGDLLVFHVDPDLLLPFPGAARETDFLQVNPAYFARARGPVDVNAGPSGWTVTVTDLGKK